MNPLIALIVIGTLGFVFGRLVYNKPKPGSWRERFVLSGAEFLALGAVLGPYGTGLLDSTDLRSLEPFMVLALAWVGLLVGLQLSARHIARFPRSYFRVALLQAAFALLFTYLIFAGVFALGSPLAASIPDRLRAALCLGAAAALSSPSAAALHFRRARAGHAAGLLRFVPAVDSLVALAAFALLFSVWHVSEGIPTAAALSPVSWLLLSLIGGVALGGLFVILLRTATDFDEIILVVVGMAIFAGGLAFVFHLSPLVVCLAVGIVLGNFGPRQEDLIQLFLQLERPLYVALLILAGTAWRFDVIWGYVLAAAYIAVRFAAKYIAARLAFRGVPLPFIPGPRWWLGLMPQGAMGIAFAVSYLIVYRDPLAETVFSALLVSTVVLALLSGRFMERALEDPGAGR
jgi:hypothetical protein